VQGEQNLDRFRVSELIHGRWAMLGVVGCLVPEILGLGNWFEAPLWAVNGGQPTYVGVPVPFDITTIILVEIVAMAGVELLRGQESEPLKRAYPGAPPPARPPPARHDRIARARVEHSRADLLIFKFLGCVLWGRLSVCAAQVASSQRRCKMFYRAPQCRLCW
jgi:Chlorophyll A-B binding protein